MRLRRPAHATPHDSKPPSSRGVVISAAVVGPLSGVNIAVPDRLCPSTLVRSACMPDVTRPSTGPFSGL